MFKRISALLSAAVLLAACSAITGPAQTPSAAPSFHASSTAPCPPLSALPALSPAATATQTPSPQPTQSASPTPSPSPSPPPSPVKLPANFLMKLPDVLYGVAGRQMCLYFDSAMQGGERVPVQTSGVGALDGRSWVWTPDKPGTYALDVSVGGRQARVTLDVAPADAGLATRKCIFIGDSTTAKGEYTKYLLAFQGNDNLKLALLGSRGKAPNLNEGRAGWKASNYMSSRMMRGMKNSFYNPARKAFDFKYYMRRQGYAGVDYVIISLGINDVFKMKSDAALNKEIPKVLARLDAMVKSIHACDKGIKVGLMVTIPPSSDAKRFSRDYGGKQTQARYRRNNFLFVSALTDRFKSRGADNVFLVPVSAGFDARNCNGVHPTDKGYRQIAESVWCWLKWMEAGAAPAAPDVPNVS
jgi:lysophospholipase L1-like esterase